MGVGLCVRMLITSRGIRGTRVTEMDAIIMPPVPAFYHRPLTLDDIINHTVIRVL